LSNAKNSRCKLAVRRLVGLDLGVEEGVQLVCFSVGGFVSTFPLQGDIVSAVVLQEGRKNFRPVTAAWPDLDHG
jgi:hypothetical protein